LDNFGLFITTAFFNGINKLIYFKALTNFVLCDAGGAINPNPSADNGLKNFTRKVVPQAFGTVKQVTHYKSNTTSTNVVNEM